ncbi:hypothetical protein ACLBX9_28720 [Methylobacterium sp. A49B]
MNSAKKSLSAMSFLGLALFSMPSSAHASLLDVLFGGGGGGGQQGGGNTGGAPSPEVNAMLGLVLAGGTVAFLKRRKSKAKAE